jgi:hypothetical protein
MIYSNHQQRGQRSNSLDPAWQLKQVGLCVIVEFYRDCSCANSYEQEKDKDKSQKNYIVIIFANTVNHSVVQLRLSLAHTPIQLQVTQGEVSHSNCPI